MTATRIVVGGGLFGCYAAIVLADRGHDVLLLEQDRHLMRRASLVNQARLHTGLHYPRSLLTAMESLSHYRAFRDRFAPAIREFTQVYAVSTRNSKITGSDFAAFIPRLGIRAEEVEPDRWFWPGTVERAFVAEEPSFDARVLENLLAEEIRARPGIRVACQSTVVGGEARADGVRLDLADGSRVDAEGVVLATYASTNGVRSAMGLDPLPIAFELTEVVLGTVGPPLAGHGFTVMDGPFWSLMPFGHSDLVSLTSVGLTPLRRNVHEARFGCQDERSGCSPLHLADCSTCPQRPASSVSHMHQQMRHYLKAADSYTATSRMLTIKAVLTSTEVDDARPTVVTKEHDLNVWTVFSGKVSTLFDLEKGLW